MHNEAHASCLPPTASIHRPAGDAQSAHPFRVDAGGLGSAIAQHTFGFVKAHLEIEHAPRERGRSDRGHHA